MYEVVEYSAGKGVIGKKQFKYVSSIATRMRMIREGDRSLTQADYFRVISYYRNIRRRETMMNRIERMVS